MRWTTTRGLMGQLFCPGKRKAYGLGCESTGHLCRVPHCQHSYHARCSSPNVSTQHRRRQTSMLNWATHVYFYPFAVETAGVWHEMAIELTQEIGRRITTVTEYTRETTFLLQCLSTTLQRGNAVAFRNIMITKWNADASITISLTSILSCLRLCTSGLKNNNKWSADVGLIQCHWHLTYIHAICIGLLCGTSNTPVIH